jgi:hypothetical protein
MWGAKSAGWLVEQLADELVGLSDEILVEMLVD